MSQLLPVLVLTVFVLGFGMAIVAVASLVSARARPNSIKGEPYECGLEGSHAESTRIPIKFYLTAILFILFDIEIIFMYPWALSYGAFIEAGYGLYVFGAMAVFLAIFIFGLFWEIKSRALEWE